MKVWLSSFAIGCLVAFLLRESYKLKIRAHIPRGVSRVAKGAWGGKPWPKRKELDIIAECVLCVGGYVVYNPKESTMTKEENLFDLSNAQLKDRLKAEGIAYADNATKKQLVSLLNGDAVVSEGDTEEVVKANKEAATSEGLMEGGSAEANFIVLQEAYKILQEENAALKVAYIGANNSLKETTDRLTAFIAGNNEAELKSALEKSQAVIDSLNIQVKDLKEANSILARKYQDAQSRIDSGASMKGSIDDLPKIA